MTKKIFYVNKRLVTVSVKVADIKKVCTMYDFTVKRIRDNYLFSAIAKKYAHEWCEVVLDCGKTPIPCEVL